jgi:hypothetical protein
MKPRYWDAILFLLASPIIAFVAVRRGARRFALLRKALRPALTCRTCGDRIVLVGMWRCGCSFTYQGHYLRFCPVCDSFPRMVRCYRCGATEKV